jgi:hypothetical protein
MIARRVVTAAAAAVLLAALWSCDTGPKSGELTVELVTPEAQLGAVSFRVTATSPATIDSVVPACQGCAVYTARVSDRDVRGVVTGRIGAGAVFGVLVPDVGLPDAYTFQVLEFAAPDYSLRSISSSRLEIGSR